MIGAGDLVVVVKPTLCCANPAVLGKVFKVQKVRHSVELTCIFCRRVHRSVTAADLPGTRRSVEVSRLRKIPPLGEEPEAYGVVTITPEFGEAFRRNMEEILQGRG